MAEQRLIHILRRNYKYIQLMTKEEQQATLAGLQYAQQTGHLEHCEALLMVQLNDLLGGQATP